MTTVNKFRTRKSSIEIWVELQSYRKRDSLLFSAVYAKYPWYLVLYVQSVRAVLAYPE